MKKIFWIIIFSISMAYVESAVVVYLRAIYYPEGFAFPLKAFTDYKISVEVFREVATVFMLFAVAALAGRRFWERFAYFMISFGVWDIFYYIWLKVILGWPSTIFDWDILFLIPIPWIGPVIAPVSIAVLMIIFGFVIVRQYDMGYEYKPDIFSRILALAGIALILYSFMHDLDATLHQKMPLPYHYWMLIAGDALFVVSFLLSYYKSKKVVSR